MTPQEQHACETALTGMCLPVNTIFWRYLELVIKRPLTFEDREFVRVKLLGYLPEWAHELTERERAAQEGKTA